MIEQIINWWNSLSWVGLSGITFCFMVIVVFVPYYFSIIRPDLKEKRKSTTQKYREGLIKK